LEESVASFVIKGDNNIEAFGMLCNKPSKRANALFASQIKCINFSRLRFPIGKV
jgi:hypothetical protein